MMALELLDTKWAGVIQPDPGSAQAGEVETEHILAPADRPCRTVRSGAASKPRPSSLALLEDVGFAEIKCFGDLDGGQLSRESRLVVRVRKPIT